VWKELNTLYVVFCFTDGNGSAALPVVMFVHCESYIAGTGNAYDGSVLAAFGHVIVVTVNFRLGVLGKNGCFSLLNRIFETVWSVCCLVVR